MKTCTREIDSLSGVNPKEHKQPLLLIEITSQQFAGKNFSGLIFKNFQSPSSMAKRLQKGRKT